MLSIIQVITTCKWNFHDIMNMYDELQVVFGINSCSGTQLVSQAKFISNVNNQQPTTNKQQYGATTKIQGSINGSG